MLALGIQNPMILGDTYTGLLMAGFTENWVSWA